MGCLSRSEVLAKVLPTKVLDVPEWGGAVKVRSMTGLERDRYELAMQLEKEKGLASAFSLRGFVATSCCLDEDGSQLFRPEDQDAVSGLNAGALDRILEAVLSLSRMSAQSLVDAEGN